MYEKLESTVIPADATIRQAILAIDAGTVAIALMVDAEGRLLGTVSDGDVRRGLLSGAALDEPARNVVNTSPRTVSPEASRAAVLDLMRATALSQIPVVGEGRQLLGMHIWSHLLGRTERPNWAVIMAGGRGTRLGPLTRTVPKPMLKVAGRPILERIVLHLVGSGVRRIFISVNYLREQIEHHFGDGGELGCEIHYLREKPDQPLGTAGSLGLLATEGFVATDPILVMNGDLVTEFSVVDLLDFHELHGAALTVGGYEYSHVVPFGVLSTEGDRLVGFAEKPAHTWLVNAGMYVIDPGMVSRIQPQERVDLTNLIEGCLADDIKVSVWRNRDDWEDVGREQDLRRARGEL